MTTTTESADSFDFLIGRWDVTHRRLLHPLTGRAEWTVFTGRTVGRTYHGGAVSVDETTAPECGFSELSLRLRSPETGAWTVYRVDSRDGRLGEPTYGRWVDGTCLLYGDGTHQGAPIRVMQQWSDVTDTSAHWEQAFSTNHGKTWERNWAMEFIRTGLAPVDDPEADAHLPKLTDGFDFLTGTWSVHDRQRTEWLAGCDEWREFEHTTVGRIHHNGAISIDENAFPAGRFGLTFRLYDVAAREWAIHWVDSRLGRLGLPAVRGGFTDRVGEFYSGEEHDGRPVKVRFVWNGITESTARWEQAYSTDGGRTWEINWIWDMTRMEAIGTAPA